MAIEIGNLSASLCSVDVSAVPNGLPKFFGPGGREFANVGFGAFAPHPAPAPNSERISAGVYRMHLLQTFTFRGGQAGALVALNASNPQSQAMAPFPPGINATGVDLGSGTDVIVTVGGGPPNGESSPADGNFTLFVMQYPTQQTP